MILGWEAPVLSRDEVPVLVQQTLHLSSETISRYTVEVSEGLQPKVPSLTCPTTLSLRFHSALFLGLLRVLVGGYEEGTTGGGRGECARSRRRG